MSRPFAARGLLMLLRVIGALLAYQAVLALVLFGTLTAGLGPLGLGIAEGAALLSVLAIWRFADRRPLRQLGLHTRQPLQRCLKGAGIAALMMGFVVLVAYTLLDRATWSVNPDPSRAGVVLVVGLVGFAIQGPAEEVLFRGYVFENLRIEWGLRWAIVGSGVSFAAIHALNPAFGALPFMNLLLFGLATALYKARLDAGQLWGVFGIHTVWNWLQQVVFGLPNSGETSAPEFTVFVVTPNTSLPEPVWGGGFGPEGTLAASLVLLALIAATLRRPVALEES